MVTVSIVSHGHGSMVTGLVNRLLFCPEIEKIIVTLNVYEGIALPESKRIKILYNKYPRGFAENHNKAFEYCETDFFCPLNPDIEFHANPFPKLLNIFLDSKIGMVAPRVEAPNGKQEDSWRYFPTLVSIAKKILIQEDGCFPIPMNSDAFSIDWAAGMFMLFRSKDYGRIGGFDEDFFLYYEDVDICARLWASGKAIFACRNVTIIHDARRDSRRKLKHLYWHIASMVHYLIKYKGRSPEIEY